MNRILSARRGDTGASAVEYGLLIAAIAAVIAVVVFALGTLSNRQFNSACSAWDTAAHTSQC